MEIDLRETPEGDRLSRVLDGISGLGTKEVLTVLLSEDPQPIIDSVVDVHGTSFDLTKQRWGTADLPWLLHAKRSMKPSLSCSITCHPLRGECTWSSPPEWTHRCPYHGCAPGVK